MKIVIAGLWHLGCVTAACCARHFQVTGVDLDSQTVAGLRQGKAPFFEPGLSELIATGLSSGRLDFSDEPKTACAEADLVWVTYDTPVNDSDEADTDFVFHQLRRILPHVRRQTLVLVSSQVPIGTCRRLEREFVDLQFAYSPENLRLGKAIESFECQERVVLGLRSPAQEPLLGRLFAPFSQNLLCMRTESAEMVKHALNSFLALSITFINEIGRLCEPTGADAAEVSAGLKSEPRIGAKAYLNPGGAFTGGTLARDVVTLMKLADTHDQKLPLIPAIKQSNDEHRLWALERLRTLLGCLAGKAVVILGLTYKPGTDILRRSLAVELCQLLLQAQASVRAYDPVVKQLPANLAAVCLAESLEAALRGADAAVLTTEWPDFRGAAWNPLLSSMRQPCILDPNRFLEKQLKGFPGLIYCSVGRA